MGLRPTQGDEKSLRPATTLYRTVALSFVIPPAPVCRGSEADLSGLAVEGSAVPRNFLGNVFRQSAAQWRNPRFPYTSQLERDPSRHLQQSRPIQVR
jgi:hypothetical protein